MLLHEISLNFGVNLHSIRTRYDAKIVLNNSRAQFIYQLWQNTPPRCWVNIVIPPLPTWTYFSDGNPSERYSIGFWEKILILFLGGKYYPSETHFPYRFPSKESIKFLMFLLRKPLTNISIFAIYDSQVPYYDWENSKDDYQEYFTVDHDGYEVEDYDYEF